MNRYKICVFSSLSVILICIALLIKWEIQTKDSFGQKNIDYSQYMNRTWVTEYNKSYSTYANTLSFYITKIRGSQIEGEFTTSLADRRIDPIFPRDKFSGSLIGDRAVCQFVGMPYFFDEDGYEAEVKLHFREDNRILAAVEGSEDGLKSGTYLFRPYVVKDLGFQDNPKTETLFPIDLDYGEEVSVLAMNLQLSSADDITPPRSYLINENEDILFFFWLSDESNTEVTAVTAEDVNGDGLKDIRFTTKSTDGTKQSEHLYHQTETGEFMLP